MSEQTLDTTESTPRIRRSSDRGVQDLGWSVNRMTFSFADYHNPNWMHFGPLRVLIESRIDPYEGFSEHPHRHAEILSYVTQGVLQHRDSNGHEAEIEPGEMQLISAGRRGMVHEEKNPKAEPEAHYQMWFIPDRPNTDAAYHEVKPSTEERQGRFRPYVSPDGRGDTMPIHTDAFVSAGLFAQGKRRTYDLPPGRGAWVQVVDGTVSVEGVTLRSGDGAGFTLPTALTFSFLDDSEVLLIDVRMDAPRIWE